MANDVNGADGAVLEVIEVQLSRPTGRALEALADYREQCERAAAAAERERLLGELEALQCGRDVAAKVQKWIEDKRAEGGDRG